MPLSDRQKYKAKAFIDMFVDRAAKALAAFVLIAMIGAWGTSARASMLIGLGSIAVWVLSARRLGAFFRNGARIAPVEAPADKNAAPGEIATVAREVQNIRECVPSCHPSSHSSRPWRRPRLRRSVSSALR